MDRFKFRAVVNGSLVYTGDLWAPKKDKPYYPVIVSSLGIHYTKRKGETEVISTVDQNFYSDWEYVTIIRVPVEQCTGFKDKNGKLIYEGDMVKCQALDTHTIESVLDVRRIPVQISGWPSLYKGASTEVVGTIHEKQNISNKEPAQ